MLHSLEIVEEDVAAGAPVLAGDAGIANADSGLRPQRHVGLVGHDDSVGLLRFLSDLEVQRVVLKLDVLKDPVEWVQLGQWGRRGVGLAAASPTGNSWSLPKVGSVSLQRAGCCCLDRFVDAHRAVDRQHQRCSFQLHLDEIQPTIVDRTVGVAEVLLSPTQSQAGAQVPILHLQGHDCLGAGGHIAVGQVHDDAVILSCL